MHLRGKKTNQDIFSTCPKVFIIPSPQAEGNFDILIDCMIFLSPFLDVTRMSITTVSFLAQLDFSAYIECFPLTYDLNNFQSRINRHLLSVGSFERDFLYALIFLCFFFLSLHAL